jgi:hypothetical protein
MKPSIQPIKHLESHEIFLKRIENNLEREIEDGLSARAQALESKKNTLEKTEKELSVLKQKLALLDVEDGELRTVFVDNGKDKQLLESEHKKFIDTYNKKVRSIKFKSDEDKKRWQNTEGREFALDERKKIRSELQQGSEQKSKEIAKLASQLQSPEALLIVEVFAVGTRITDIPNIIDWLGDPANVDAKISNTEWYKRGTPAKEMNDLRKQFKDAHDVIVEELKSDSQKLKYFAAKNQITYCDTIENFLEKFSIYYFQETEDGKKLIKSLVDQKMSDLEQEREYLLAIKQQIIQELKQFSSASV